MVAIKAKVSKLDSCDLEADKVKDEFSNVNSSQCEYLVAADFSLDFQVTH